MNKNIRYVDYKDEAERSRLIAEYEMYGYYVKDEDGRITVNSKWPKKVKNQKAERRGLDKSERR